ncbi:MAG: DNA polymerase III subunit beta [Pseudomonadota bacterium]
MKFTVNRDVLVKELAKVQGVGERKTTVPILSNALISVEGKNVSILSTNMEVGVLTTFEAEVVEKGKTTASAKNLYDICKEMPAGMLDVETEDNNLKIKGGKAEFKVLTLPAADFPKVHLPSKSPKTTVESSKLIGMMDKVLFCASTDETKYHLNSIFIDNGANKGTLRFVSTDGHRLGMVDDSICDLDAIGAGKGILLPRKGAYELRKIMDTSKEVSIMVDNGYFYMYADNAIVFAKEMDLEYPEYSRVVPTTNDKQFRVKRDELLSALRRVSLMSTIKSKTVLFNINQGALLLSSRSPESGEATEEIEIDYSKTSMEIKFNSRYVMDILSSSHDEVLNFNMGDPLSPVLIKPDKEDTNVCYVVMPMRI